MLSGRFRAFGWNSDPEKLPRCSWAAEGHLRTKVPSGIRRATKPWETVSQQSVKHSRGTAVTLCRLAELGAPLATPKGEHTKGIATNVAESHKEKQIYPRGGRSGGRTDAVSFPPSPTRLRREESSSYWICHPSQGFGMLRKAVPSDRSSFLFSTNSLITK